MAYFPGSIGSCPSNRRKKRKAEKEAVGMKIRSGVFARGMVGGIILLMAAGSSIGCEAKPVKEYYKDGKLQSEGFERNGNLEGVYKSYYENGRVKTEAFFKGGRPEGAFKSYYENGKLEVEAFFSNGIAVGALKEYDEKGKLKRTEAITETIQEAMKARFS